jgi:tetratricopeptide (TPR) repeat protein
VPPSKSFFASRALQALVLGTICLGASPALARRTPPATTTQAPAFQPAESLEGNYLAAYIAGASRDTAAAATFYREALKEDPRNPELLERAFISLLADGAMPEALRIAERLVQRDKANGLAQLALGVRELKSGQYNGARTYLSKGSHRVGAGRRRGRQAGARTRRQAQGREDLQRLSRLPRRPHRRARRQHRGGRAALEGRLRCGAHDLAHRRCLWAL